MAYDDTGIYQTTALTPMLWPKLLKAEAFKKDGKEKGEPKFGAAFAFAATHPDLAELKKHAVAVARAKWPGVGLNDVEWPFKSGPAIAAKSEKMSDEMRKFLEDKTVLQSRTKNRPALGKIVGKNIQLLDGLALEQNGSVFYSGVNVLFEVNFWANVGAKGEKYITAYLNAVVSSNTGTAIGGGQKPLAERFKGYIGHATAEDPTRGELDDEIPF